MEKNKSKINLIKDSAADQKVDVVVNAANRELLQGGGICGVIFEKAGEDELNDACGKIDTPLNDGDAVITPAFKMENAKYIIHAVGPDFNRNLDSKLELYKAYYNSLNLLKENGLKSIAFPLISSGIYGGSLKKPAKVSASMCLKAYEDFIKENPEYYINVKLCAFSTEELKEAKEVFK